jgi:chorismate mutase
VTRERFDEIRQRITENDEEVIAALNRRLELVAELWKLKEELGLEVADPGREQRLRAHLAERNAGPLTREGVDEIVTVLLDLTKRELGA